jgi:ribosome maturation factor RimP
LQYVLEVEAASYERLEVSSPGIDRPLKKAADYARFAGSGVQITLKQAFQGRKKYKGQLSAEGEGWRVVFTDDEGLGQALDFTLEEVKEARLVPALTFKGRNAAGPARKSPAAKDATPGATKVGTKKAAKRSNAKARQGAEESPAAMDDKVDGGLEE